MERPNEYMLCHYDIKINLAGLKPVIIASAYKTHDTASLKLSSQFETHTTG